MQHCQRKTISSPFPPPHRQVLSHHGPQIPSSISAESQYLDIKTGSNLRHGDDDCRGREEIKVLCQLGHDTGTNLAAASLHQDYEKMLQTGKIWRLRIETYSPKKDGNTAYRVALHQAVMVQYSSMGESCGEDTLV